MRSLLSSMVTVAVLAAAVGCGGNVVVGSGGNGGGGNGGGGSAGSNGTAGTAGTSPNPTGTPVQGWSVVLDQGGFVELHFASGPLTCDAPDVDTSQCGTWEVTIGMPPDLFVPGVINLENAPVKVFMTESAQGSDPNGCAGSVGGGGGLPATLIIQSVGAQSAEVELQGFNVIFLDAQPDGPYVAPICAQ